MSSILQSNGTILGHPFLFDNMFVCPYLASFACLSFSMRFLLFVSLLVCWLVSFVIACTRMEHGQLEQGYDFLNTSKMGKDASKKM